MPRMTLAAIIAAVLLICISPVQAKPRHHHKATAAQPRAVIDVAAIPAYGPPGRAVQTLPMGRGHIAPANGWSMAEGIIGGRPSGCPHRYCGCSASLKVFGKIIPELNLAANWRRFPSASPAPGMAAWRWGHVFVIQSVNSDGTVVAHDGNSGRGLTRIHTVSLRGYRVVDPNGNPTTFSARKVRVAHR